MPPVALYPLYLVFDVESVGLHGEGFAVGYVVISPDGKVLEDGRFGCPPETAMGNTQGHQWVRDNLPPMTLELGNPADVRNRFWDLWSRWHDVGAVLVADCPWPVEARFLATAVDALPEIRYWKGPYPFLDVASARLGAGLQPMGPSDRLPNELPVHDPLADARQSARLFAEALAAAPPRKT